MSPIGSTVALKSKAMGKNNFNRFIISESNAYSNKVIKRHEGQGPLGGNYLSRIVNNHYYVTKDTSIIQLSEDLASPWAKSIFSVGVVDDDMRPIGVINRREFFNTLSKPQARELFQEKNVTELMQKVRVFSIYDGAFSVANELESDMMLPTIEYYLVEDKEGFFFGSFSTKDVLHFLSKITKLDLNVARSLQSNIVKEKDVLDENTFSLISASKSAKEVGGDFYNIKKLSEDEWLISLCDVSGKGVSASLVTAFLSGAFAMYDFKKGVKSFVKNVNQYLVDNFSSEKFVTGVFILLNVKEGSLLIYDMGHSHVYVYRDNKLIKLSSSNSNMPLGVNPDAEIHAHKYMLKSNDILTLFTDGIVELGDSVEKEYPILSIAKIIKSNKEEGVKAVSDALYKDIEAFSGESSRFDDMSLILLEYK